MQTRIPAKFTEVLGNIVDYYHYNIFNFDYPIFVPNGSNETTEKTKLQNAFIQHYYLREIGQEIYLQFFHYLRVQWCEIIETYNRLAELNYNIAISDFDKNDNFKSSALLVYNDAPKGEITFDNSHATNFTNTTNENSGLHGLNKYDVMYNYNQQMINVVQEFLLNFEQLFMGVF